MAIKKKNNTFVKYIISAIVLFFIFAFSFSYAINYFKEEQVLESLSAKNFNYNNQEVLKTKTKKSKSSDFSSARPLKEQSQLIEKSKELSHSLKSRTSFSSETRMQKSSTIKDESKLRAPEDSFNAIRFSEEKLRSIASKPEFSYPISSTGNQLVQHKAFALSYNERFEQAEWVSYTLTKENLGLKKAKRKNNFRPDPTITTFSAHPNDYKNSGYDRGHLAPAGDLSWFEEAMSESFYMSNISPQVPAFNRGIWKRLEDQVREWAIANKKVYVVTGPVLKEGLKTIGQNNVAVPEYFYKIVLDIEEPELKAIGFIMPNSKSDKTIKEFSVTIDSIENLTNFDFFSLLPDSLEEVLENRIDLNLWFDEY